MREESLSSGYHKPKGNPWVQRYLDSPVITSQLQQGNITGTVIPSGYLKSMAVMPSLILIYGQLFRFMFNVTLPQLFLQKAITNIRKTPRQRLIFIYIVVLTVELITKMLYSSVFQAFLKILMVHIFRSINTFQKNFLILRRNYFFYYYEAW